MLWEVFVDEPILFSQQKFSHCLQVSWDGRRGNVITLLSHILPERWMWDADSCKCSQPENLLFKNVSKTSMKTNCSTEHPIPLCPLQRALKAAGSRTWWCPQVFPCARVGASGCALCRAFTPLACSASGRGEYLKTLFSLEKQVYEVETNSRGSTFPLWCLFFCCGCITVPWKVYGSSVYGENWIFALIFIQSSWNEDNMEESRSNTSNALVAMGRCSVLVRGQYQQRNSLGTPWLGEIKQNSVSNSSVSLSLNPAFLTLLANTWV